MGNRIMNSDIILPDDVFYLIQEKLFKGIRVKGTVSWQQIKNMCSELMKPYNLEYNEKYGKSPEYKIFMPLLRNGSVEVINDNGIIKYTAVGDDIIPRYSSEILNPYIMLTNTPSIKKIIESWSVEDYVKINFCYNDYEPTMCSDSHKIGLYKCEDKVFYPFYLYDGEVYRKVPSYNSNPDSINVARCFIRASENQILFIHHKLSKKLNVLFYSELPILITRALVLFDIKQLGDNTYRYPLSRDIPYHNININTINEIARIFGKNCIGVKND